MDSGNKKLFIGADEAGYGPNLGPLLIAASAWTAPAHFSESDFSQALNETFFGSAWIQGCQHIPLGDSKKLYRPGGGLTSLELGLLATMSALDRGSASGSPRQFSNLDAFIAGHTRRLDPSAPELPWYLDLDQQPMPQDDNPDFPNSTTHRAEINRLGQLALAALEKRSLALVDVQAILIDEPAFNAHVQRLGSKGQLLSEQTLGLVADLLSQSSGPAEVYCDRQGGRKNYMPILTHVLPDEWFQATLESPQRSSYRCTGERDLQIHFSVGGDQFAPTALASMLAKYIRERLMHRLNAFWAQHVSDLKPTAGYPTDAARFRKHITAAAERLQLPPERWWRCR